MIKAKIKLRDCISVLALAVFLNGCAETEIRTLNNMKFQGSPFSQALAEEYKKFSTHELRAFYDETSAFHFARKGERAADGKGESLEPESLECWGLSANTYPELHKARLQLLHAFSCGSRQRYPEASAAALRYFDEWVEQKSEGWQPQDIANARAAFYTNLHIIEKSCGAGRAPAIQGSEKEYDVYFAHDSDVLDAAAQESLDHIARHAVGHKIVLNGETDASGTAAYDLALSKRRAAAVKNALVRRGIPQSHISLFGNGKAPGAALHDAHHRRVRITLH